MMGRIPSGLVLAALAVFAGCSTAAPVNVPKNL